MEFDRSPSEQTFSLLILGQHVTVKCPDGALMRLLAANFSAMAARGMGSLPGLEYRIEIRDAPPLFSLSRGSETTLEASDAGDLLFLLEKDVTVELQKRRPDLFFLHSAAIRWQGNACLLAAESGQGKSTTTWALLHHEFGYLSDELSPIDLGAMQVSPYPHALCLKRPTPSYPLPAGAIHLGRTFHLPAESLPGAVISEPCPLGAVFLINYSPDLTAPTLRSISPAEAAARLYVTALNALAHARHGLDAVVRIAQHVPCFAVSSAGLPATCALIRNAAERVMAGRFEAENAPRIDLQVDPTL